MTVFQTKKTRSVRLSPKEKLRRFHRYLFMLILTAGLLHIFFPLVAHADIFNNDVQDVYATITENVDETNEILKSAFQFTQALKSVIYSSMPMFFIYIHPLYCFLFFENEAKACVLITPVIFMKTISPGSGVSFSDKA